MSEYTLPYMFYGKQQDLFKHFSIKVSMMWRMCWRDVAGGRIDSSFRWGSVGCGSVRTPSGACPSHGSEHHPSRTWKPLPGDNFSAVLSAWKSKLPDGLHTGPVMQRVTYQGTSPSANPRAACACSQGPREFTQRRHSFCKSLKAFCSRWHLDSYCMPTLPVPDHLLPHLRSRELPIVYQNLQTCSSWASELLCDLVAKLYLFLQVWTPSTFVPLRMLFFSPTVL